MRKKFNLKLKLLALFLGFLSLPVLTSTACITLSEGIAAEQWKLGCEGFPTVEEVEQLLAEHHETVQRIKDVHPHHVFVNVDPCPGGAGIRISYGNYQDRLEILKILDEAGATDEAPGKFFGVPFRMNNI